MQKYLRIAIYIYFAAIAAFFSYGFIFAPAELRCATAYFVAPGNVEKVCAKLKGK